MNMPGMSISILNLSNVSADTGLPVDELLSLIDAPHNTPAWPATQNIYPLPTALAKRKRADMFTEVAEEAHEKKPVEGPKLLSDASLIQKAMSVASEDVIALEPELTRWDTIVGDGDCGETCAQGATAVLGAIKSGLGSDGDVVHLFRELTEIIDGEQRGAAEPINGSGSFTVADDRRMRRYPRRHHLHLPSRNDQRPHRRRSHLALARTHRPILRSNLSRGSRDAQTAHGRPRRSSHHHGRSHSVRRDPR